jgi:outer membrane protein assembly factor BamB
VIVEVGASEGAGIVAFAAADGATVWKATDHEASYSSPIVHRIGSSDHLLAFTREGLVDLDPRDGRERFGFRWRARIAASVNAATPIAAGDLVFVSSSYQTGATVIRLRDDSYESVWKGDGILSNHYATSVAIDGHLYGLDGRQEAGCNLRCVALESGVVRWSVDRFGAGTLIAAGKRILVLGDDGRLTIADAAPAAFARRGSAALFDGEVRAYPALAQGILYARDQRVLRAWDLRAPAPASE